MYLFGGAYSKINPDRWNVFKVCLQNEWCLQANRVINEQKKKNEEDFKNESSENKCQIKKQFTVLSREPRRTQLQRMWLMDYVSCWNADATVIMVEGCRESGFLPVLVCTELKSRPEGYTESRHPCLSSVITGRHSGDQASGESGSWNHQEAQARKKWGRSS